MGEAGGIELTFDGVNKKLQGRGSLLRRDFSKWVRMAIFGWWERTPPSSSQWENPCYYMLTCPQFRSAFILSIYSLTLSGFPLTSFHLAEASLSCFSWLYALVCAVVQIYHEISFIYNYFQYSFLVLILQSACFICTTGKRKQTMEQKPHRAMQTNKIKAKTKPRHFTFKLTTHSIV